MEKLNLDNLIPIVDEADIILDMPQDFTDEPETPETIEETPPTSEPTEPSVDEPAESPTPEFSEPATLFYQELVENGLATPKDGQEQYSWDDVNSVISNYKEELPVKITEQLIAAVPDVGKDLIDYVFTKGDSLSKEDLLAFTNKYIEELDTMNIDVSNLDNAKSFLSKQYKAQGFRDSQIEVMIDALEDDSDETVIEEAQKVKTKVYGERESKKIIENTKQEKQSSQIAQKEFASKLSEELNNTNWKPTRIQKIHNDLVSGNTNKILQKVGTSPKALIQLANLATYYNDQTGEFNFDDFINQAISPKAKSLKDKITSDMFSTGTRTKENHKNPNKNAWDNLVPVSPIN